jgi:hypothetical protein
MAREGGTSAADDADDLQQETASTHATQKQL